MNFISFQFQYMELFILKECWLLVKPNTWAELETIMKFLYAECALKPFAMVSRLVSCIILKQYYAFDKHVTCW